MRSFRLSGLFAGLIEIKPSPGARLMLGGKLRKESGVDYAREAARHREMAEEYRVMAGETPHEALRVRYEILADAYDQLADNEARVANNLKKISN
jgi:hypothetical protein